MQFLGDSGFKLSPDSSEEIAHPVAVGQIVEIVPQSELKGGGETPTRVTLHPSDFAWSGKEKKEADIVRGFQPPDLQGEA